MSRYEDFMEYRMQGLTHTEIAALFGVSHQHVAQTISQRSTSRFRPYKPSECVYDGLREWMNREKISRRDIARVLYGEPFPGGGWTNRLHNKLTGKSGWRMCEIDKLCDASGLTYEQLFRSGRWSEDGQAQGL